MAFTFTPENQKELDWLLTRYPTRHAVLLPAIRLAEQQIFDQKAGDGVSTDALEHIAKQLKIDASDAWGVFTFYTQYRRPGCGKYLFQTCATLPCALRGAKGIHETIEKTLGLHYDHHHPDPDKHNTSADGMFSVKKVECLGGCGYAPVVQINDDYFENLTPDQIKTIIKELKAGKALNELSVKPVSGPSLQPVGKDPTPRMMAASALPVVAPDKCGDVLTKPAIAPPAAPTAPAGNP
ncbi:MAG TPA: NAD(P)H-dependent oxidoreductase subunit E [Planctomycetota bacterium]|nr:NAD(P)H-dependent oxidoreductase subunit E [Planctomycetota bacterium]